jgi:photosystem II stability/assembly factor-like uncharacterized protein
VAVLTSVVLLLVASAPGPLPQQLEFWNANDGVGVFWHCTRSCRPELRTTIDGGRSWQFARTAPRRGSLTIAPGGYAWIGRFVSTDGGRRWRSVPSGRFLSLAFSDADHGWGVDSFASDGSLTQRLARTSSSGRRWSQMRNPCDRSGEALVDLSSPTPAKAWALCSGLYGAGNDAKAIYHTRDTGAHWALVNQSDFKGSGRRNVGAGLPVSGYVAGLEMSASGRGWLWEARGPAFRTRDGGRRWHVVALTTADAREAWSISFPSDDLGLMLIRDYPRREYRLDRTRNGGRSWSVVRRWRFD